MNRRTVTFALACLLMAPAARPEERDDVDDYIPGAGLFLAAGAVYVAYKFGQQRGRDAVYEEQRAEYDRKHGPKE